MSAELLNLLKFINNKEGRLGGEIDFQFLNISLDLLFNFTETLILQVTKFKIQSQLTYLDIGLGNDAVALL